MGNSETLRSVIDAGRTTKRLDELTTARVIGKVAEQLHAAHQKAGAGKAVGPLAPIAIAITGSGAVTLELGPASVGYISPELASGGAGDRRSDVFSLGVVMWEALTHQRLFDAMNDAAVKVAIQGREIASPSELNANIPAELSAICMRALARTPADRYQSAKVMAVEIEEFLNEAGYADNDELLAMYVAGMPILRPKGNTLPPPTPVATPTTPPPPAAIAAAAAAVAAGSAEAPLPALPSVLKQPTQQPPNTTTTPAGGISPLSFLKSPTLQPPNTTTTPTAPPAPATPPAPAPAPEVPAPKTGAALASALASAGSGPMPAITDAAPAAASAPLPAPIPVAAAATATAPAAATATATAAATTTAAAAVPAAPLVPMAPVLPSTTKSGATAALKDAVPKADDAAAVPKAAPATGSGPNPAAAVALGPMPGSGGVPHRDSKDVLSGWGWKTDSHAALDESDYEMPASGRKPLLYVIGAGVVLALIVTVIAVGFGGSKTKKNLAPVAATKEGSNADLTAPPTPPTPPEPTPGSAAPAGSGAPEVTPSGSDQVAAATPGSGSATAEPTKPEPTAVEPAKPEPTAAVPAKPEPAKPEPAKVEPAKVEPAKPEPAKPEPAKIEPPKPDKVAKLEPAKPDPTKSPKPDPAKVAKVDPTRPDPTKAPKPDPTKLVKAEPTKPGKPDPTKLVKADPIKKPDPSKPGKPDKPGESKADVEAAYRTGLQQFARGDTAGALASLRTSLAGNPSYPPTWRGLGLVFEKMGERDQARAAFKRYLQLSPNAGDAESIRGRLERLGS